MPTPFTCQDRGICNRGFDPAPVRDAGSAPQLPTSLSALNQAIVDEAILRGASFDEVMDVLFARALPRTDVGVPAFLLVPGTTPQSALDRGLWGSGSFEGRSPRRPSETIPERVLRKYEESLVARTPGEAKHLRTIALREVEALLPLVMARYQEYVAQTEKEFNALSPFVRASFAPIRTEPYVDTYATAQEKYRAMRGAYYRAGWPYIKRDVLDLIEPTTFFGAVIIGGTHRELKDLLRLVEADVRKNYPGVSPSVFANAAGFGIAGLVPRFQRGSAVLSNHALGLAIDIDFRWNPQVKTPAAAKAFKRATGEDWGQLFVKPISSDYISKLHARIVKTSDRLKAWLNIWLPKYDQLQEDRRKVANDQYRKAKIAALDKELKDNPDLAALHTLMTEYEPATVRQWQAYGIVTIPLDIIERFVAIGVQNRARWGGEYAESKDIMHLELLQLASKTSLARPGGQGRRTPVASLTDLYHPNARPIPVNWPR